MLFAPDWVIDDVLSLFAEIHDYVHRKVCGDHNEGKNRDNVQGSFDASLSRCDLKVRSPLDELPLRYRWDSAEVMLALTCDFLFGTGRNLQRLTGFLRVIVVKAVTGVAD
jgi:hypothetical protein